MFPGPCTDFTALTQSSCLGLSPFWLGSEVLLDRICAFHYCSLSPANLYNSSQDSVTYEISLHSAVLFLYSR